MAATDQLTFDHIHVISRDPKTSAQWYIDNLGATVTNEVTARGATQIVLLLAGMRFLIRGQRPGEGPTDAPGFRYNCTRSPSMASILRTTTITRRTEAKPNPRISGLYRPDISSHMAASTNAVPMVRTCFPCRPAVA